MNSFRSPQVCRCRSVDQSVGQSVVETEDLDGAFPLFMSLGSGAAISVDQGNRDFLLSVSREFGNSDLCISLLEHFGSDSTCSQLHDSAALDLFSEGMIRRISVTFSTLSMFHLQYVAYRRWSCSRRRYIAEVSPLAVIYLG
jgi:hypothetical protein